MKRLKEDTERGKSWDKETVWWLDKEMALKLGKEKQKELQGDKLKGTDWMSGKDSK